jgi:hypothetical protein
MISWTAIGTSLRFSLDASGIRGMRENPTLAMLDVDFKKDLPAGIGSRPGEK